MGVIVTEQYDLGCGLNINSYYASINTNDITMGKHVNEHLEHNYDPDTDTHTENITTTTQYTVDTGFTLWISKEARDTGKSPIGRSRVNINQETPITGNLYDVIYAKFKEIHPSSVDA